MSMFPAIDAAHDQRVAAEARASAAADDRLREREADFTPRETAEAVLRAWLVPELFVRPSPSSGIRTVGMFGDHGLRKLFSFSLEDRPLMILDMNAGAGVWGSAARMLLAEAGIRVHITAVEFDPSERVHLERHADEVIIADWHVAFGMVRDEAGVWVDGPDPRHYDIVIGNPAFTQARAQQRPEWEAEPWDAAKAVIKAAKLRTHWPASECASARSTITRISANRKRLTAEAVAAGQHPALAEYDPETSMVAVSLRHAPVVCLYASQQAWTKTASGFQVRLAYPPALAYDIPGSISHRTGTNPRTGKRWSADSIPYAACVWHRGHEGATSTILLEPFEGRSWTVRPGTESDAWLAAHGVPLAPGNIPG